MDPKTRALADAELDLVQQQERLKQARERLVRIHEAIALQEKK